MIVIYHATTTRVGACTAMVLGEQVLIIFCESALVDIEEYCFIYDHGELAGPLTPDVELQLGDRRYLVTTVGKAAEQDLRELGHVTSRFDDHREVEFPGTVHVAGPMPNAIATGYVLKFVA